MTEGSLRLSGSFESLQQHAQNGKSKPHNLYLARRPSKTSLAGYREKETFFSTTFRYLIRKKVGMLILAAFCNRCFHGRVIYSQQRYFNKSFVIPSLLPVKEALRSKINKVLVCNESTNWGSLLNSLVVHNSSNVATVLPNPCKDFAFPPPPPEDTRRISPRPCLVCYVPMEQAVACMPRSPSPSPNLQHLTYFSEENPSKTEPNGGSDFGGYPLLKQSNDSFDIRVNDCSLFVKGCRPGHRTGFDVDVRDLEVLEQFHDVIVASTIFGNYDVIQQPKNIGAPASRKVPFCMFVDEETEAYMKNSSILGSNKQVGLWRIIVIHDVPYTDTRRNGKVCLLRLGFFSSIFSIVSKILIPTNLQ